MRTQIKWRPGHFGLALSAVAVALTCGLLIAACGGSDESDSEVLATDEERQEELAAEQERRRERIAELESQLDAVGGSDEGSSSSTEANPSTQPYASEAGGWEAEVPIGEGWTGGTEAQLNPGLHRTTFTGPRGEVLIVDTTPAEAPSFVGDASRGPFSHPRFPEAEKIVFRGNTVVTPCETSACIDFLLPYEAGGYAVLIGGPGGFTELEALGEAVALSLRPR